MNSWRAVLEQFILRQLFLAEAENLGIEVLPAGRGGWWGVGSGFGSYAKRLGAQCGSLLEGYDGHRITSYNVCYTKLLRRP